MTNTVTIDEDVFVDMLWDRVENCPFGNPYDEDFWTETFEYFEGTGWMQDPRRNDPKYIIDNIVVNGSIKSVDEVPNEFDLNGMSVEEWAEAEGYPILGGYVVINWGL